MAPKRSNRSKKKKRKMRSSKKRKMRSNTIGLIYYKMSKCDYCKIFEKELWNKVINHCKKNNIKHHMVVRELNPELIPNNINSFPSLVKYDKNMSTTVFNNKRTLANIKNFLK
jgi:hypothetical protein